jgi:nondiscriminating aspartyl-tRNA synthetase
MRIRTIELSEHVGEEVLLRGWLLHRRELSAVTFLILRDGFGTAQIAVPTATSHDLASINAESAIEVRGRAVADERAPAGVEVRDVAFSVLSDSDPLSLELHRPTISAGLPTLLDHAAVTLRHISRRAAFRLMHATVAAYRASLVAEGFTEIFTPKIVASATEGGANCFTVDYFGRPAALAQSPQLYKQIMVGVFERVFEVGPVFRAEPHDTPRHLNEYISLDMEMGFITDHRDPMAVLTRVIAAMAAAVERDPAAPPAGADVPIRVPAAIPTVHFTDALELLSGEFGPTVLGEPDLGPAHERWLGDWALHEHGSDFLFVTGFPMKKRPFYTHPDPMRPEYSNSFDLLFRGQELATGGQRLHRYRDYEVALHERNIDPAPLAGYLEAFRHGMPRHGGFAIGLERWVQQVVRAANLRETTLFPRDIKRLAP